MPSQRPPPTVARLSDPAPSRPLMVSLPPPLVYKKGQNRQSLGLSGEEVYGIQIDDNLKPAQDAIVRPGDEAFVTGCRIDIPVELEYYRTGGLL